jgi:hypothetical protein
MAYVLQFKLKFFFLRRFFIKYLSINISALPSATVPSCRQGSTGKRKTYALQHAYVFVFLGSAVQSAVMLGSYQMSGNVQVKCPSCLI